MTARKVSPLVIKTSETRTCSRFLRFQIISQVPFFHDLTPSNREWINTLFHEKGFEPDEVICHSGEPAEQLYVIAEGRVKLIRHSVTGKNILLDLLNPGEFFGAISRLGNDVYPETAQAQTPCCILVIDRDAFQLVLSYYPTVALKMIDIMVERLKKANERVHQLISLSVEARIANILLMLADKFGEKKGTKLLLQVPLSREDLAGMTGATIESTSRVMSKFQKRGLILSGRRWVAVIDKDGLEEIAGKELY